MMKRWLARLDRPTEIVFAGLICALGIGFVQPSTAFALSNNYRALALIASEETWGLVFLAVGWAWVGAALAFRRKSPVRLGAGLVGSFLLLFTGLSIFWSNPAATWGYPLSWMGVCSAWVVVRAMI